MVKVIASFILCKGTWQYSRMVNACCVWLQVLMNSKLPVDILGRIWELSDIDKDGYLDRDEFALVRLTLFVDFDKAT